MQPELLTWYLSLCVVAIANPCLLAYARWRNPPSSDPERAKYQRRMLLLAVPMVFECAWRSVFPSLYLQRFTFWDTPLNSIIVDRSFACVGEITWTAQIALAVYHVDKEVVGKRGGVAGGGRCWVAGSCVIAVLTYVVAEAISYYNTATTNELWAAVEVAVDALAWVVLFPAAASLACRLRAAPHSSGKLFVCVFAIAAVLYPAYNFGVDCPMYLARYRADQAAGKQYFRLVPGLIDAATRRVPTHALADWKADMLWMLLYFTFGAWSSIALVAAPTTKPPPKPHAGLHTKMLASYA